MHRLLLAVLLLGSIGGRCEAQWLFGPSWEDDDRQSYRSFRPYDRRPWAFEDQKQGRWSSDNRAESSPDGTTENKQLDGGARPVITAQAPPIVDFTYDYPQSSIIIDTAGRKLYFVLPGARAYAYSISVGREGFSWTGTEQISRKQEWPDWYPPREMRERDPKLPEKMTGGLRNPLGAMALYLGNTLYRIHGTNDVKSLGQAQSSGCFRMMNSAVVHLASVADVGTMVTVVASLSRPVDVSKAEIPTIATSKNSPEGSLPGRDPPDVVSPRDYWGQRDERNLRDSGSGYQDRNLRDYRDLRNYTFGRRP
jgi:lipoprotein-anchoring transpeptidase ErfK/SrfK